MKLKEFSTTGIKSLKGIATITFTKSGCISFNRKAVETIGLKTGDKLIFFQDEENPKDWYMKISEDKGAELRRAVTVDWFVISPWLLKTFSRVQELPLG